MVFVCDHMWATDITTIGGLGLNYWNLCPCTAKCMLQLKDTCIYKISAIMKKIVTSNLWHINLILWIDFHIILTLWSCHSDNFDIVVSLLHNFDSYYFTFMSHFVASILYWYCNSFCLFSIEHNGTCVSLSTHVKDCWFQDSFIQTLSNHSKKELNGCYQNHLVYKDQIAQGAANFLQYLSGNEQKNQVENIIVVFQPCELRDIYISYVNPSFALVDCKI